LFAGRHRHPETTLPYVNPTFTGKIRGLAWRSINGAAWTTARLFHRRLDWGTTSVFVRAEHARTCSSYIIAYDAGSSYSTKTATFADNLVKRMNETMRPAFVGWRRNLHQSQRLSTKDAKPGLGGIAKAQRAPAGHPDWPTPARRRDVPTFEIIAPTESTLNLRTYTTQRGVDRRASTANPVILSQLRGNLANPHLGSTTPSRLRSSSRAGRGRRASGSSAPRSTARGRVRRRSVGSSVSVMP
jgi:hypothetical protein